MKYFTFWLILFTSSTWAQTSTRLNSSTQPTGRVVQSEEEYNQQNEKCKVGSSAQPATTQPSGPTGAQGTNASKAKVQ